MKLCFDLTCNSSFGFVPYLRDTRFQQVWDYFKLCVACSFANFLARENWNLGLFVVLFNPGKAY